jgi:hypothetical protein
VFRKITCHPDIIEEFIYNYRWRRPGYWELIDDAVSRASQPTAGRRPVSQLAGKPLAKRPAAAQVASRQLALWLAASPPRENGHTRIDPPRARDPQIRITGKRSE